MIGVVFRIFNNGFLQPREGELPVVYHAPLKLEHLSEYVRSEVGLCEVGGQRSDYVRFDVSKMEKILKP